MATMTTTTAPTRAIAAKIRARALVRFSIGLDVRSNSERVIVYPLRTSSSGRNVPDGGPQALGGGGRVGIGGDPARSGDEDGRRAGLGSGGEPLLPTAPGADT